MTPRLRGPLILAAAIVVVAGCGRTGQVVDAGAAPTREPAVVATAPAAAPDDDLTAPPPATAAPDDPGRPSDAPGSAPSDGAQAPGDTTIVEVFLPRGEQVEALSRSVPRVPRIGTAALEQLLAGPTADEQAAGYGTEIPDGTRLRNLAITDGVATVDLSSTFESGGGTLALTIRVAQVVCTLDQFPTVDGVRFALDGTLVDVLSGDGLIVDEPVSCDDYAEVVAS